MLPADFHLTIEARLEGRTLLGGEPFAIVHLSDDAARRVREWRDGAPVGEGGVLARELVMANLAQPVAPVEALPPVTAVIPVRDRSLTRLLAALDVAEVIVIDDASADAASIRAEAKAAGARYLRRETRGGAGAARNVGLAAATHDLVACVDSDCVPRPGWLEPLLPHFADPEVCAVAPRIVALDAERQLRRVEHDELDARASGGGTARGGGGGASPRGALRRALARYEAARSPLDRGPNAARVIPYGRVPFVPGAALVVRRSMRFDEALRGGEDVEFVWRVPYVRYEPAGLVAHDHRTDPGAWFKRRVYYGRTAAGIAKRHPGNARALNVSPWTTAAWIALAARRPGIAAAITATAVGLLARELRGVVPEPVRTAAELAGLGSLRSGRVIADALTRQWWPLAAAVPRLRRPLAAAVLIDPLRLPDNTAYGLGVWIGCLEHGTVDPLLPARPWRLEHRHLA